MSPLNSPGPFELLNSVERDRNKLSIVDAILKSIEIRIATISKWRTTIESPHERLRLICHFRQQREYYRFSFP
jgi:hypothetical protein